MRILVIGGAGFIGATLCRRLINEGHYVICIDDLSTGSADNIKDIQSTRFVFRVMDILTLNPHDITSTLDHIYMLACPASPPKYQIDPIRTLNICFNGTLKALDIAKITGAKILFTSTSEIYGDPLVSIQSEEYRGNVSCTGPRACYDEGKRVAETLIIEYANKHNVDYSIARIFNTYGPFMSPDDGRVMSNFIKQMKQGNSLTIYGDGSQTRSFCYVTDTVDGLVKLMNSQETGPINIGNPESVTILDLAEIIAKKHNGDKQLAIEFHELPIDDPKIRCPDISKARKLLGWEPTVTLQDGIDLMISHFF